jgi:hypothetical protein
METFDTTVQVLRGILSASSTGWAVSGGLVIVAFAAMRAVLPVKGLATLYAPALLFGGLAGIFVCQQNGLVFSHDEASNAVIAATGGLVVALFAAVLATRVAHVVSRVAAPEDTSADFMRSVEPRRTGIRPSRPTGLH